MTFDLIIHNHGRVLFLFVVFVVCATSLRMARSEDLNHDY